MANFALLDHVVRDAAQTLLAFLNVGDVERDQLGSPKGARKAE